LIDAPGEINGIVVADRQVPTKTQSEFRVKLIELFETMMIAWAAAVVGAAAQTSRVVASAVPARRRRRSVRLRTRSIDARGETAGASITALSSPPATTTPHNSPPSACCRNSLGNPSDALVAQIGCPQAPAESFAAVAAGEHFSTGGRTERFNMRGRAGMENVS